jgi:hypothetical protein
MLNVQFESFRFGRTAISNFIDANPASTSLIIRLAATMLDINPDNRHDFSWATSNAANISNFIKTILLVDFRSAFM